MPITNGSVITAANLDDIYTTGLATLRTNTAANVARKQYTVTFRFNQIKSTTAEHLRTKVWVPRTDVVIRNARISAVSVTAGLVCTVEIPAQIVSRERIVGGNLPYSLVGSATTSATVNAGVGQVSSISGTALSTSERVVALAGDNIEIIVAAPTTTECGIWVTLLVETVLGE
jgi:hypothetical protein